MFRKKIKLVTHDGGFHADDIFATATLILYYRKLKKSVHVTRTRDRVLIENADIVFDVGGVYDAEKNRFDHHQHGGAGFRPNGVPYAAFGLVWNKFGFDVAGNQMLAAEIDSHFVQNIDASDNGMDTYASSRPDLKPITVQNLFGSFAPTFLESNSENILKKGFDTAVAFAVEVLERKIAASRASQMMSLTIEDTFKGIGHERFILFNDPFGRTPIVGALSEQRFQNILYAVYPQGDRKAWRIVALRNDMGSFENRKSFPENWRGKTADEMRQITGVADAEFTHNSGFLAGAKTRESAVALARLAIQS